MVARLCIALWCLPLAFLGSRGGSQHVGGQDAPAATGGVAGSGGLTATARAGLWTIRNPTPPWGLKKLSGSVWHHPVRYWRLTASHSGGLLHPPYCCAAHHRQRRETGRADDPLANYRAVRSRLPAPEETEAGPVPADQGVWLDDNQHVRPARPEPEEDDPEAAIARAQTPAARCAS
jgi:hypothetical protein